MSGVDKVCEIAKKSQNLKAPTPTHYATLLISHPRCMVSLQLEPFGNIIYNLTYKYIYFKAQVKL